jgi:hypothetical protein
VPEPHYETGTYGLYACSRPKVRAAFVKNKVRYLFFVTKYAGTNTDYTDKMLITGYYHIVSTADARRFHIRNCPDYECLEVANCTALRADETRFVSVQDAFEVTEEVLKDWDYGARITRQTRIIIDEEKTSTLLEYLRAKEDARQSYLDETKRLQPHGYDDEEEDEEEDDEDTAQVVSPQAASEPVDVDANAETVALPAVEEAPEQPVSDAAEAQTDAAPPLQTADAEPEAGEQEQQP